MSYMSTVRSGPRLKQSTAITVKVQIYADDARSPYPGDASTVTVTFAKGGAAAMTGSSAPTLANDGNGMFQLAFTIGNLDTTGPLYVRMTATGADDAWYEFYVTADDPTVAKATAADLATAQTGITEIASDTDTTITNLATAQTGITEIASDTDTTITNLATAQTGITEIASDTDSIGTIVAAIQTAVAALPTSAAIRDAVWAKAHESGRTVLGVVTRLDAIMTGKATGLLGTLATYFRSDGTTKAIEATQNPGAGTRTQASTISGD